MPFTADYRCGTCEHVWTAWQSNSQDVPTECENCGSDKISRLLGGNPTKCHDPKVRSEVLKKRSAEHSAKHFKDNYDRVRPKIMKR